MGTRLFVHICLVFLLVLSACDSSGLGDDNALAQPNPVSPTQAQNTADAVLLDWSDVDNAKRYRVQLSTSAAFSTLLIDAFVLTRSQYVAGDLEHDITYHWRVMALSESKESPWSTSASFIPNRFAQPPSQPSLALPVNGTLDLERSLRLEWEEVEDAISYHLVVTIDEQMLLYQADLEQIEDPFFEIEGLIFTYPYWWKVRALGPAGYSDWSPVWIFQVKDGF